MRYIDPNIRLTIGNIDFKAYLEDNSETYEIKETTLPFVALNDLNNAIITRVLQKVRFVFNVFSEDRKEAFDNYKHLKQLINTIKPTYYKVNGQYVPSAKNLYGSVYLKFGGMPLTKNGVNIQIYNFTYEVNKEIGYIQMPSGKEGYKDFYRAGNMELVPLAYKVTIEGRLPNNIAGQANIVHVDKTETTGTVTETTTSTTTTSTTATATASATNNGLETEENNILDKVVNTRFITRKALDRIDVNKKILLVEIIKTMINNNTLKEKYIVDGVGSYEINTEQEPKKIKEINISLNEIKKLTEN